MARDCADAVPPSAGGGAAARVVGWGPRALPREKKGGARLGEGEEASWWIVFARGAAGWRKDLGVDLLFAGGAPAASAWLLCRECAGAVGLELAEFRFCQYQLAHLTPTCMYSTLLQMGQIHL